jgi:hypothetical protein
MWWAYTRGAYIRGGGLIVGGLRYEKLSLKTFRLPALYIILMFEINKSLKPVLAPLWQWL